MAARKRKPDESYKEYRKNLKREAFVLRTRCAGKLIWNSGVNGTYVRPRFFTFDQ